MFDIEADEDGCEPEDYRHAELDMTHRRTGRPALMAEQCSTCIGRPGNLMDLRPGRVKQMAEGAMQGAGIICHQTLPGGSVVAPPAMCRWFYDRFGPRTNWVRIMLRLGGFTTVLPVIKGDR